MAKSKDKSEVEHLRGLNRQLLKQLKKAGRQVNRAEKQALRKNEDVEDVEEVEEELQEGKCSKCKARLAPIDLGVRIVYNCTKCGHREARKK